jgi:hypothetical protein
MRFAFENIPGRARTCNPQLRRLMLFRLSYEDVIYLKALIINPIEIDINTKAKPMTNDCWISNEQFTQIITTTSHTAKIAMQATAPVKKHLRDSRIILFSPSPQLTELQVIP